MKLNGTTLLQRDANVAWQNVDDKIVVITPSSKKIHILSGSAETLWECLENPVSLEALTQRVCETYDVDKKQAQNDVESFLKKMNEKQMIQVAT